MFPNQANLNQLVGKKKRIRPRKQNPSSMKRKANRLINLASMSQYQAPHHDEPEDLTDDLAPKTSATNANVAQTAQQTQPGNIGADNKLNFKFQKTVQKTPNWAKYQNNFKTISGASPDREPDELQQYEKQNSESGSDQKTVELKQTGFDEDVEMKEVSRINAPDLKVAVTTEPFQYLNTEQVKKIDTALASRIQDAILNDNNNIPEPYIPVFQQKPVHHLGHLPLTCSGAHDLMWLHETLSTVPSPVPNTNLVITLQSRLPQLIKIGMFIPNFSGNIEDLQMFLQKQNHWYDMSSWTLINSQKQGDDSAGYYLLYCVPEKQVHIIDNRDRRMAYSLGTVFITVYDKQWNEQLTDKDQEFNFRNVAKHLLVCVVTKPFHYLTVLEVEEMKSSLSRKIANAIKTGTEYIPTFRGSACHYRGGLSLWCESDQDLKWLKEAVASIDPPIEDCQLIVMEQIDVPQRAKLQVLLPNCSVDKKNVVKILQRQNVWCDIKSWVLFSVEESPDTQGFVLVFYVPIEQVNILMKKECRVSYLLGYLNVKFDGCYDHLILEDCDTREVKQAKHK